MLPDQERTTRITHYLAFHCLRPVSLGKVQALGFTASHMRVWFFSVGSTVKLFPGPLPVVPFFSSVRAPARNRTAFAALPWLCSNQ